MVFLKTVYYIAFIVVILIALLMVISVFPIPGNYKVMVVQSGSMEPKIKTGSAVFVKPASEYKVGDVITFGQISKAKAPTTHRIFEIKTKNNQPIYITKGDTNEIPDQKEIAKNEIIGKVLFSIPYLGFFLDFAKKPLGYIFLIIVPAIIIIFWEARKIWQEVIKIRKEKIKPEKSE